jgi:transcriptional regulator with XRE-family HTH domain
MESSPKKRKKEIDSKHQEILNKIGLRMKEIRKEKGYKNYEAFAYEKGLPRAQYGKYERGGEDANMTLVNLIKILDAFDMTLEEFFSSI